MPHVNGIRIPSNTIQCKIVVRRSGQYATLDEPAILRRTKQMRIPKHCIVRSAGTI